MPQTEAPREFDKAKYTKWPFLENSRNAFGTLHRAEDKDIKRNHRGKSSTHRRRVAEAGRTYRDHAMLRKSFSCATTTNSTSTTTAVRTRNRYPLHSKNRDTTASESDCEASTIHSTSRCIERFSQHCKFARCTHSEKVVF